jgi:hypothetical protein
LPESPACSIRAPPISSDRAENLPRSAACGLAGSRRASVKAHRFGDDGFDDAAIKVGADRHEFAAVGIVIQNLALGKVRPDSLPYDGNDVSQGRFSSVRPMTGTEVTPSFLKSYITVGFRTICRRLLRPGGCVQFPGARRQQVA